MDTSDKCPNCGAPVHTDLSEEAQLQNFNERLQKDYGISLRPDDVIIDCCEACCEELDENYYNNRHAEEQLEPDPQEAA